MEGMVLSFDVGVVKVDAQVFKETCLTYPHRILRELEYHLPKIAAVKSNSFVTYVKVHVPLINYILGVIVLQKCIYIYICMYVSACY